MSYAARAGDRRTVKNILTPGAIRMYTISRCGPVAQLDRATAF